MFKKRLWISQNCFFWAMVDSNFWICKSLNSKFETITYEPGPIHHTALPSYAMAYPIQHVQLHRTLSLSTAPPIWQTPHSIDDSSNSSPMWHERCDVTCTPTSSPVWHGCIVQVSCTCNRVLVVRCEMNTGTLFYCLTITLWSSQCGTDVLQNGSLTTVAGSGHHYIALIKPKDSVVIYKAILKISRRTGTFQCSQR